jgi:aspartyl-tRNA(Asn)/glutamyl-tRNA(Gln) amidotransferase subunit C
MRITDQDVAYVADLAHLDLTPEERATFGAQLDSILGYVEQLNELDTSSVAPMAQVLVAQHENETLRDDVVRPSLSVDAALANAPERGAGYFKVPKVIER